MLAPHTSLRLFSLTPRKIQITSSSAALLTQPLEAIETRRAKGGQGERLPEGQRMGKKVTGERRGAERSTEESKGRLTRKRGWSSRWDQWQRKSHASASAR